ncbi:MAG: hypothetical protein M3Y87_15020 [Myxococcota bacterium]|nr:hypothetical protein [Myxococcota bacterium]
MRSSHVPLLWITTSLLLGCGGTVEMEAVDASARSDGGRVDAALDPADGGAMPDDAAITDAGTDAAIPDAGPDEPMVDRSDARLRSFELTADEADPAATRALATQLAYLDTRSEPQGRLVVYLHGAGAPSTCGSRDHGRLLASWGFHVVSPCYLSDYGIGNCGDDIGGCRLEAFEGVDHHDFVDIEPPDAIERRVVRMLMWLDEEDPGGDWSFFLTADDQPRWDRIVISGISHGASTSGLIAMHRGVDRAVMLSGPLDRGQAWLRGDSMTPVDRIYGFTHTDDGQHPGHLEAFEDLQLAGAPTVIDSAAAPYGGSHRLVTSADSSNGHSATQAGGASPRDGDGAWRYEPAWRVMYGAP